MLCVFLIKEYEFLKRGELYIYCDELMKKIQQKETKLLLSNSGLRGVRRGEAG